MNESTDRNKKPGAAGAGSSDNKIKLPPSMSDITEMMKDSMSEHHQLERYRMLIECYGSVSFEYNTHADVLGFDFWWHDGQQHIILVEHFLAGLHESHMIAPDSRQAVRNAISTAVQGKTNLQFELQADI